jgi:hypothetical protein
MEEIMKKVFAVIAILACGYSSVASAVPVRATFDGSVSGSSGFNNSVLNDFPVGTTASFDLTFDDANLLPNAPLPSLGLTPVSGWMRLGSLEWLLDGGSVRGYSYMATEPFPITSYGLQFTGSGPTIGANASLFGLFMGLTPDLALGPGTSLSAGFEYPVQNGAYYSYANLAGTFNISRVAVPEPGTMLLLTMGLGMLWFSRRSRFATRTD